MKLTHEEEIWLKQQQSFFKNHNQNSRNAITGFLTPKEQMILKTYISEYDLVFDGGFSEAERKQVTLLFYPEKAKPYVIFEMKYNNRFQEITHRDVLGSLVNLGIERREIGDIVVLDKAIQLIVSRKIAPFIEQNLDMIKKVKVKLNEIEQVEQVEKKVEECEAVVASFRLDVFVATFGNVSRKIAGELIEKGAVQVNHQVVYSGNYQCNVEDLISIRKYGRFLFKEIKTQSKKSKYRILYYRYI